MKSLIIIIGSTVAMLGCVRNVPVPQEGFDIAKKTCATYNSVPESITGEYWFPTFSENIKIVCKREDPKEKFVVTLELK